MDEQYRKDMEDKVVESYRRDEDMMVLVFAQWCVNNGIDPVALYAEAYPGQEDNEALRRAVALTVSVEEAGFISNETVLGVLSLFGNDDLAFAVTQAAERLQKERTGD